MEAAMIRLDNTSGGAIAAAISAERHRQGSPTTGMVLTMLILTDEEFQSDATSGAVFAARQHPMRIVTVIPKPGKGSHSLDAEIAVGGDDGPGEVAVLRLRGELSDHADSVVIPLLLSDTPVVAFWPSHAPAVPAEDTIGRHAQRRITDSANSEDPLEELRQRGHGYRPGDTDLSWSRLTPWRSVLATVFDQPTARVTGCSISAESNNPSASLLATWLEKTLNTTVEITSTDSPGIQSVIITTESGEIAITRADGRTATLSQTGAPDALISLPRRDLTTLLNEDLRRLDPDDVYGWVIRAYAGKSS
jgi:glucose-6-phosphate dehydrogenase assembly protein OpcA